MDNKLRFVIQKHNSQRQHYDLRLEFKGILKSWAIPEGLPPDHEDNRLAIETKDHPITFLDYEDRSEGEGGENKKMEIWDRGQYYPSNQKGEESSEEVLESGFKKGKVTLTIEGSKINGYYTLVKTSYKNRDHWLLKKKKSRGGK